MPDVSRRLPVETLLLGGASALWSFTPLLIHFIAQARLPALPAQTVLAVVTCGWFCLGMLIPAVNGSLPVTAMTARRGVARWLLDPQNYWLRFESRPAGTVRRRTVEVVTSRPVSLSGYAKMPLVWCAVNFVGFYLFYIWASELIETAVVAAIIQLWPLCLILGVENVRGLYFGCVYGTNTQPKSPPRGFWRLAAFAAVGVICLAVSQIPDREIVGSQASLPEVLVGLTLAVVAMPVAVGGPCASIAYAYAASIRLKESAALSGVALTERDLAGHRLWCLLFVSAFGKAFALLLFLPAALVFSGGSGLAEMPSSGIWLVGLLATTDAFAALMLRLGNKNPETSTKANYLNFVTPAAALALLMLAGIDLPRFGWFLAGAAVCLTVSAAAQLPAPNTAQPKRARAG